MHAPEVFRDFPQQARLIRHQFGIEAAAAFEGVVAQHTLAKAVDREYRRFVETAQGVFQPPYRQGRVFATRENRGED